MNASLPRIIAWIVEAIAIAIGIYIYFSNPSTTNLIITLIGGAIGIWNIEAALKTHAKYSQPNVEMPTLTLLFSVLVLIIFGLGGMYWAYQRYLNGEMGRALFNFGFGLALFVLAWKAIVGRDKGD